MSTIRRRQLLVMCVSFLALTIGRAQESTRIRRLAVLNSGSATELERQREISALQKGLQDLDWKIGRTLRIDYWYANGDSSRMPKLAKEVLRSRPDVIFAGGTAWVAAMRQQTLSIPIVFVQVSDPVALGFVNNLGHPNGNMTGFAIYEFSIAGKWLQILREAAPKANRIAVLFEPAVPSWISYMRALEGAAPHFGMTIVPASATNPSELDDRFTEFLKLGIEAIVVLPGPLTLSNRARIIATGQQHRLPSIYPYGLYAKEGGLMSYGLDILGEWERGAAYIDRILKGAKPADLPIQQSIKYEFVINLKTAKILGLSLPQTLLNRADELVE